MKDTKKKLNHRDLHPGDYVFVDMQFKEDNVRDGLVIIRVDIVTPTYVAVKEGSGVTKYAWNQIHPISLTVDNLKKFDLYLISDPRDDYSIFAKGLVTIDAEIEDGEIHTITPSVYFNDGDGAVINYLHEAQQYIYEKSNGTYDFKISPRLDRPIITMWEEGGIDHDVDHDKYHE